MAQNEAFSQRQSELLEAMLGLTLQPYSDPPRYFMADLFYATCLARA